MKNAVISVICICFIAFCSIFSVLFMNNFTDEIRYDIQFAQQNNYSAASVDKLENTFNIKKNVLILISSKDHINILEECIINIKYAAQHDDKQNLEVYTSLLLKTASDMENMNKSPV